MVRNMKNNTNILSELSTKELEVELRRRRIEIPPLLKDPDLSEIKELASEYIMEVQLCGKPDLSIYEGCMMVIVMIALYGENIWEYLNTLYE